MSRQALAERGYDADQVDAEIAADRARERQLGLSLGSASSDPTLLNDAQAAPADNQANVAAD